jgi:hypothetical protein
VLRWIFAARSCIPTEVRVPRARASGLDLDGDTSALRDVAGEYIDTRHVASERYGVTASPVNLCGNIQLSSSPDLLRIHLASSHS